MAPQLIRDIYLLKRDPGCVPDVAALPFEQCVGLVPDNEHNISRNLVATLVPFLLERYFVPAFQPGFTLIVNTLSSFCEDPSG
jgi:hypothetical protein